MKSLILIAALTLPACSLLDSPDTEAARTDVQAVMEDVKEAEALIEQAKEAEEAKKAAEAERKILEVRLQEAEMRETLLEGRLQLAREANDPERIEHLEREIQAGREGRMQLGTFLSDARSKARTSAENAAVARDEAKQASAIVASLRKEQSLLKQRLELKEKRDLARYSTQGIEAFEGISGTVGSYVPWAIPLVGILGAFAVAGKSFTRKTAAKADEEARAIEHELAELRRRREAEGVA